MTKLIVAFHNFGETPKNVCLLMTRVTDYVDVISFCFFFILFLMLYEDTNPVVSQKCRVV